MGERSTEANMDDDVYYDMGPLLSQAEIVTLMRDILTGMLAERERNLRDDALAFYAAITDVTHKDASLSSSAALEAINDEIAACAHDRGEVEREFTDTFYELLKHISRINRRYSLPSQFEKYITPNEGDGNGTGE